jgi:uncharacterized membrane protein
LTIKIKNELLPLNLLVIVFVVAIILFPSNILRIVLGIPLVLFFPGYTLMAVLFPRRERVGSMERVALSFGISIAVVPLIGLILKGRICPLLHDLFHIYNVTHCLVQAKAAGRGGAL